MNNDRELLEQAAKAAGYGEKPNHFYRSSNGDWFLNGNEWNPLTNDGDALRLAVKLNLLIDCCGRCARPLPDSIGWQDGNSTDDPCAATRRAIVRAAAEIGKATK